MSGLKKIEIEGFKLFKSKQEFEFSVINIITGKNNSGKSSLIKILKLLSNCAKKNDFPTLFFDETDGQDSFCNQINNETENESKFIKVTVPFDFLKLTGETYIEFWFGCETTHLKKNGILSCIHIFNLENDERITILKISNLWGSIGEEEETKTILAADGNFPSTQYTIWINYRELNKILKLRNRVKDAYKENIFDFNLDEESYAAQGDYEIEQRHLEQEFQKTLEKPFYEYDNKMNIQLNREHIDSSTGYMKFIETDSQDLSDLEVRLDHSLSLDNRAHSILKDNYESPFQFLNYFIENYQHQLENDIILLKKNEENESRSSFVNKLKWDINLIKYKKYLLTDLLGKAVAHGLVKLKYFETFQFISPIRSGYARYIAKETRSREIEKTVDVILRFNIFKRKIPLSFISFWINEFELGSEVRIETTNGGLTKSISLKQNDVYINIVDLGFGVGQLIPIIFKVAVIGFQNLCLEYPMQTKNSIICLEEPETSLHPALQSKIADFVIDASFKFGIQFIIETHSEYLVRKMQYWIAKKKLDPSSINIFYLSKNDKIGQTKKQVTKISIDEDGALSEDFGPGFFDEADKIAIDIWNLPTNLN